MILDVLKGAALDETSAQDLVVLLGGASGLEKMPGLQGSFRQRTSGGDVRFCRN